MGLLVLLLVDPSASVSSQEVKAFYLYNLSNFTGPLHYNWAKLYADREENEIYLTYGDTVKIFNQSGMEVYSFGSEQGFGLMADVAVERDGHILVLSYTSEDAFAVIRSNFRGKPISKIAFRNFPPEYADLYPNRIFFRGGHIYLADLRSKRVAVTDTAGLFNRGYNITALIGAEVKPGDEHEIAGFSVDREGNMLFTIPTLFKAFKLTPEGGLSGFGTPGSVPGKFNVVAGIDSDDEGRIFIADTLRCVIMVFDKEFAFLTEFGYRGLRPGELIAPKDVVTDTKGRVYVSQARGRGVSVFKVSSD